MTQIIDCPLCRKHHKINFIKLNAPIIETPRTYTHYGVCVNTGQSLYYNPETNEGRVYRA